MLRTLRFLAVAILVASVLAAPIIDRSGKSLPCSVSTFVTGSVGPVVDCPVESDEVNDPGLKDLIGNCQHLPIN
jgi:hypothetical protein